MKSSSMSVNATWPERHIVATSWAPAISTAPSTISSPACSMTRMALLPNHFTPNDVPGMVASRCQRDIELATMLNASQRKRLARTVSPGGHPGPDVWDLREHEILRLQWRGEIRFTKQAQQIDFNDPAQRVQRKVVRQQVERILNFSADRIKTEERVRQDAHRDGGEPAQRTHQAKRQYEAINMDGAMKQQNVCE